MDIPSSDNFKRMDELLSSAQGQRDRDNPLQSFAKVIIAKLGPAKTSYPQILHLSKNGTIDDNKAFLKELKAALTLERFGLPMIEDRDCKLLLEAINFKTPLKTTGFFSRFTSGGGVGRKRLTHMVERGLTFENFLTKQASAVPTQRDLHGHVSTRPTAGDTHVTQAARNLRSSPTRPTVSNRATTSITEPTMHQLSRSNFEKLPTNFMDSPRVTVKVTIGDQTYEVKDLGVGGKGEIRGRGAFGRVLVGLNVGTGEKVAIKFAQVPPGARQTVEDLKREASTQADIGAIGSPHLLGASAYGVYRETVLTVMKPQDGGELYDRWQTCSTRDAVQIMRDAASGLESMHAKGFVHRDLKLENVMCDGNPPRGTVIDYGFTRQISGGGDNLPTTGRHGVCGTPGYVDPEFVQLGKSGKKSDVFSYGALLYTVFAKEYPPDDHVNYRLRPGQNSASPDLRPFAEPLSGRFWTTFINKGRNLEEKRIRKDIAKLIQNCMKRNPMDRPTMEQVREQMDGILTRLPS